MTQNLWDAAKAVLRGKFIAIQSYLKKQETSQINNLTLHLKQLEKEKQQQKKPPNVSRRKEIVSWVINGKQRKGNPLALLVGMSIDTATMENRMGVP